MAQSYMPAGAGQSGSMQTFGGAIAGLFGQDDELKPRYGSDILNSRYNAYVRNFLNPKQERTAFNEYNDLYRANDPIAKENAGFYDTQARGILGDNTRTADTYERLRSGNLSSLSDVFSQVLDHGLASQKARMAAGGYGESGPSSYDRILNSTMAASNLTPVLNTIYGNLGRDAMGAVGGDRAWDAYRMGQFALDPLTGYVDAATAGRALTPLYAKQALLGGNIGNMAGIGQGVANNIQGYDLVPGLASRLNNLGAAAQNALTFTGNLSSTFGGMGMGGGGGGGMLGGMMGGGGGGAPAGGGGMPQMGGGAQMMQPMMQQAMPMIQQYWPQAQQYFGGMQAQPYANAYTSPSFSGIGTYGVGY